MPDLMQGKRGLIMGVANDHSIAWGVAKTLAAHGAKLAFTYQGEALGKRVKPLAASVNADLVLPCDVEDIATVDGVFAEIGRMWGALDFLVHAIAFSDKAQLAGRYADTTRENFLRTMLISCFSFTEAAKRAAAMMRNGGAMLTLTYNGGLRAMPNYNVMGPVKAALEATTRYLSVELGEKGIRVYAVSPGPLKTRAASGIAQFDELVEAAVTRSAARRLVDIAEVGRVVAFLVGGGASGMTGDTIYVDAGLHVVA